MIWTRRLAAVARRIGFALTDHRWMVLSVAMAVVGVLSVWVTFWFWISGALAVVTVAMLAGDLRRYVTEERRTVLFPRAPDDAVDVRHQIAGSARFDAWHIGNTGTFVLDAAVSEALRGGAVDAALESQPFIIPPELRDVTRKTASLSPAGIDGYNGHVVGLNTNVGRDPGQVPSELALTPARYLDHLSTDILAMSDVLVGNSVRRDLGRPLYVDRRGRLRDFGDSWLLNALGVSVLAITTDGRVVAVRQSEKNQSSGGLLAPSGSGSCEPVDFGSTRRIRMDQLATVGGLREMYEETGILPGDVASAHALGFGRWVQKAGKPELMSLALLTIDSHEVMRRPIPKSDRPFTAGKEILRVRFGAPGWSPAHPGGLIDDQTAAHSLSLPLAVGLNLVEMTLRTPSFPASAALHEHLRQAVS